MGMTARELREKAEQLQADRVPFVHARVVLAERPTSAKPGDEAIVRTAEEVALSILAEVIAQRTGEPRSMTAPSNVQTAVDPVCHMDVVMVPTSLHADVDGETWWFCCQGCLDRFVADPAAFARA